MCTQNQNISDVEIEWVIPLHAVKRWFAATRPTVRAQPDVVLASARAPRSLAVAHFRIEGPEARTTTEAPPVRPLSNLPTDGTPEAASNRSSYSAHTLCHPPPLPTSSRMLTTPTYTEWGTRGSKRSLRRRIEGHTSPPVANVRPRPSTRQPQRMGQRKVRSTHWPRADCGDRAGADDGAGGLEYPRLHSDTEDRAKRSPLCRQQARGTPAVPPQQGRTTYRRASGRSFSV